MEIQTKKRILLLNYEFPPLGGGASPVSFELAKKMSETGLYDIEVVTMGYKDLPSYEVINDYFRIHRVRCWRSKKEICHPWEQLTYLISAWKKCRDLISKNSYDLCHCHFIIPTGILALNLKRVFGLPYIITAHGSDVLGYNKRFKLLYPLLVHIWKKILNNAVKVISPSDFLKKEILKVYSIFNEEKITVIPNGFDPTKFKPQEKKRYIFSSGRLLTNKGFQYLIKAVSDENIGYEVHIAGEGPMRQELEILAKKSKTPIVFHGWMDNKGKEYRDLLEQSSIYVLVSEKENASIALLEAMSAGCAMITTNMSGTVETVGEAGILVDPHNVISVKDAITTLLTDEAQLRKLQLFALQRLNLFYDWNAVLSKYKDVI